jgi:hypothetical protein
MNAAAKLPFTFDSVQLQADLARIRPAEWITHFNTDYFDGAWTGVSLRMVEGEGKTLYVDPAAQQYADTPLLQRCSHFAAVLGVMQCPLKSVRLLKLTAGSSIREHRDHDLGWDAGEIRLHVPIVTHPKVEFFLKGQRILMQEGECWYLDLHQPHRVENRSEVDRVHLVIDCLLNDWLRKMIENAPKMAAAPDVESEFDRFRGVVLRDSSLQARLLQVEDRREFTDLLLDLGRELGIRFTAGDVDAAFQAARRAWLERWI